MANIINGKEVSNNIKLKIRCEVDQLLDKGIKVCLAVILVGEDPASCVYVRNKEIACEACNIESRKYALPADTTESELLSLINELNNDNSVNAILCQLPLPKGLDEKKILNSIDPKKDVDAFHPENVGHIMIGDYSFLPCTPAGVMELIESTGIDLCGKNCVVIGRSNIVGKPMSMLLLHKNATVTICHSKTKNLKDICKNADVLISAVGRVGFVTSDMVGDGAVVIDVGINRDENNKLCGDVCFDDVSKKASYITPVPGGVGPMTIAMLMKNTLTAAKQQNGID